MSVLKNIIVAGGGSSFGKSIISSLHANPNFKISALKRPNSNSTFPSYVHSIETDFSLPSLISAFQNQDAVISAIGFEGTLEQIKLVDAAIEAGVKRFVPSEFGWSKDAELVPLLVQRFKVKDEVLEYLMRKCEGSQMSWSVIASGVFLDWTLNTVPVLGFVIPSKTARIYDSGTAPFTATTGLAVGKAVTNLLLNPQETANRYLKIVSFKTTQNQMLKAFEDLTASKWEVTNVAIGDVVKDRPELLKQGRMMEVRVGVLAEQLFSDEGRERGITAEVADSDNVLLGVEEEDVTNVLKRYGKAEFHDRYKS